MLFEYPEVSVEPTPRENNSHLKCPPDFRLPQPKNPLDVPPINPLQRCPTFHPDTFRAVDLHSTSIQETCFDDFRDFMWQLVYSQTFSELERARVIFRFLSVSRIENIEFRHAEEDSPEAVFNIFKAGELASYSRIYQLIACYSGLHCVNIQGYTKGPTHLPGDTFNEQPTNHTWNAVYISGSWCLVDTQWATRYIMYDINTDTERLVYEFDDFYFCMDPRRAIYSHFPLSKEWQLIPKQEQINLAQFQDMPVTKSQFFASGMTYAEGSQGVLYTTNGCGKFSMCYQELSEFTFKLEKEMDCQTLTEEYQDCELRSFALLETEPNKVTIYFRLPFEGVYFLTLFSKLVKEIEDVKSNVFRAVCVHKIVCSEPCKDFLPYMGFTDTNFGPSWPLLRYYNIDCLNTQSGIIEVNDDPEKAGKVEVVFQRGLSKVGLVAKLREPLTLSTGSSTSPNGTPMYSDELVRSRNDDKMTKFEVALQNEGEYILEVYANDPEDTGDTCIHVCQYLIDFKRDASLRLSSIKDVQPFSNVPPLNADKLLSDEKKKRQGIDLSEPDDVGSQELYKRDKYYNAFSRSNHSEESVESIRELHEGTLEIARNKVHPDCDALIYDLIHARGLTSDLDKIRVIFLWLCTKDLSTLEFCSPKPGTPEENLMKIKYGKTSYAEMFQILCKAANIQCRVINGYAKGVEFRPGMKLERNSRATHSWNAAKVHDHWHLFDCHWAARRLLGELPTTENIRYYLDDFFFMTDPEHLKYSHHPFEEKWQLTPHPFSLQEFEDKVPLKSSYFIHNLEVISHLSGLINCGPNLVIKMGFPEEDIGKITFTFSLTDESKNVSEKEKDLSAYGMHECISQQPPIQAFTFRFPRPGIYSIFLFVRNVQVNMFTAICEYRAVVSDSGSYPAMMPFPPTIQNGYGPTETAVKMGLCSDRDTEAVIKNVRGCVHIKLFHAETGRKMPTCVGRLRGMNMDENVMANSVMQRVVPSSYETDEKEQVIVTAFLPKEGEFALEIYVRGDERRSIEEYFLCWQFLILCDVRSSYGKLPVLPGNLLGAMSNFKVLGLEAVSHPDPYIIVEPTNPSDGVQEQSDLTIQLALPSVDPFTYMPVLRVIAHLFTLNKNGEEERLSQYLLQQTDVDDRTAHILVRFPHSGLFKLQLYAHPIQSESSTVPLVYTYLCECRPSLKLYPFKGGSKGPFPEQTNKWRECGVLHHPLDGIIKVHRNQPKSLEFYAKLPQMKDVVVVIDEEVQRLKSQELTKNKAVWEGVVNVPATHARKLILAYRPAESSRNYRPLLEYQIEVL